MTDIPENNYSLFDRPEILNFLFHPRKENSIPPDGYEEILIPVEEDIEIGARIYPVDNSAPMILFFHGNGEIVADYADIAQLYLKIGINFFPVDYRGYGRSTGTPTVSGMMKDSRVIFEYVKQWLNDNAYTGPFIVMGRSLGSASALEIASYFKDYFDGMIIESGFAFITPLLRLLGINADSAGISEEIGFRNLEKISTFDKPTLIIHAEYDHIIPFSDGQALFDASPSADKQMLEIKGADHNTVFFHGIENYLQAVIQLIRSL